MRIDTNQDQERAIERLARRDSKSLATFIVSIAQDTGPIGELVRTFIVGDDVVETVESVRERVSSLRIPDEYEHRHARGREMGARLEYILKSIELLVLPVDPKAAFELLVAVFEADSVAMENCGDSHFEVSCAFGRAAELMTEAG